jgi:hypothetical protein
VQGIKKKKACTLKENENRKIVKLRSGEFFYELCLPVLSEEKHTHPI